MDGSFSHQRNITQINTKGLVMFVTNGNLFKGKVQKPDSVRHISKDQKEQKQ